MAIEGKYTGQPLQVNDTEEVKQRIYDIAYNEGISQAQVVRDIIGLALARREKISTQRLKSG